MEFLFVDWLGTPAWFWLSFLAIVIALTAFDLGFLHKEDREMGIEALGYIVGIEYGSFGRLGQTLSSHHADIHP